MRIGSLTTMVVLLTFGCGGAEPSVDERAVRLVIHQYVSALAHDDFDKACSLLTNEASTALTQSPSRNSSPAISSS